MSVLYIVGATIFAYCAAFLVHESGHYIMGLACGCKVHISTCEFKIFGLSLRQPLIVADGAMTDIQERAFAMGGFAFEFIGATIVVILAACCGGAWTVYAPIQVGACTAHLISYPFFNAGSRYNDFNRLV